MRFNKPYYHNFLFWKEKMCIQAWIGIEPGFFKVASNWETTSTVNQVIPGLDLGGLFHGQQEPFFRSLWFCELFLFFSNWGSWNFLFWEHWWMTLFIYDWPLSCAGISIGDCKALLNLNLTNKKINKVFCQKMYRIIKWHHNSFCS